jgi:hypothetical protein
MVDKDGNRVDITEDLVRLEDQMTSYVSEIDLLLESVRVLDDNYQTCFEEINPLLPKSVKDGRKQRQAAQKQAKSTLKRPAMPPVKGLQKGKSSMGPEEPALSIYTMISVNCKYKQRIQKMLKELKQINKDRKKLEDDFDDMRKQVFKMKQIKLYKPVKGDEVDEMFAEHLNKAKLAIDVQRISASNYMFGTKKILAKIINDHLVIRVGGGYMNAAQFIEQYGHIEIVKMLKLEESKNEGAQSERPGSSLGGRMSFRPSTGDSTLLANDVKEKMRQSLYNVKAYEGHQTVDQKTMGSSLKKSNSLRGGAARRSVDISNIQTDLKSALEGLKKDYKRPTLSI